MAGPATNVAQPKGPMADLEQKLGEENDTRAELLQEEHVQLMRKKSQATLKETFQESQVTLDKIHLEANPLNEKQKLCFHDEAGKRAASLKNTMRDSFPGQGFLSE